MSFETPILFLVFNRPDHTRRVFEQIREAKPKYFFIAADGPRKNRDEDIGRCSKVREIIAGGVDWDCQIKTLFRDENLGSGKGVSDAITWFFDHVEEGIVLEDDCYPDTSFFSFCENALRYFQNNDNVLHVAGSNFQCGVRRSATSFFYSKYPHSWGWATWRRAWNKYRFDISNEKFDAIFNNYSFSKREKRYWRDIFSRTANHEFEAWDYSWIFCVWKNKGVSVVATNNLVRNIGFGADSTHTNIFSEKYDLCVLEDAGSEFVPNSEMIINISADKFTFETFIEPRTTFANRIRNVSYRIIPKALYQAIKKMVRAFV